jgi:hypothetical protein
MAFTMNSSNNPSLEIDSPAFIEPAGQKSIIVLTSGLDETR